MGPRGRDGHPMIIGAATVRCSACGAAYDIPIHAQQCAADAHALRKLRIDTADAVTLRLFADAHRGPIVAAR